jgi:hypothetical protein
MGARCHDEFGLACEAMLQAIADAANPKVPEFSPYVGWRTANACWWVRHVLNEARHRGLYPTTAQLESDSRKAA